MPAIIGFLGYNPLPEANTWGARLIRQRTTLGLSQKEAARVLRVDPGTLARWERGEREPAGKLAVRVERFLATGLQQPRGRREMQACLVTNGCSKRGAKDV